MKKEQIQEFTRRISLCNRGELVVIMYDIFFAYLNDVKETYESENWEEFKGSIRGTQRALGELISALDFSQELAKNLFSIYVFCRESLAASMYKRDLEGVLNAERLMMKLYNGFVKAAEQDTSPPLMSNTQQVYAGYTYGKDDLIETCQDFDASRGFFV